MFYKRKLRQHSLVKDVVLESSQLLNHRLDSKHEELVTQVQAELKRVLPGTPADDGVDEGHDSDLEGELICVVTPRSVQIHY